MPSFNWSPSFSSSESSKPRVSSARFGDGYEQRIRMGNQTDPKKWQLEFNNRTNLERDEIRAFLESRGGAEAFNWTTPWGQTDRKWVCEEWNIDPLNCNNNQIRATFRQVYDWSLITEVSFGRPAWDSGYSQFRPGALTTSTPPVAAKQWVTSATTFAAGTLSVAEVDPYFSQVSLLLHFEGANNSTTFTDSGPLGLTVTAEYYAKITTADFAIGNSCYECSNVYNQLALPSNNALTLNGDFTLEWRAKHTSLSGKQQYFCQFTTSNIQIAYESSGLFFYPPNTARTPFNLNANTWYALAISRSNGTLYWFVNGTLQGSVADSTNYDLSQGNIARYGGQNMLGLIDEVRITKGVARYTSNYTVRTAPFPNA